MMNSDESLEGRMILESPSNDLDEAKWSEIMNRDKLRPGQPPMTEEEEAEFINRAVKETREARRAERDA